MEDNINCKMTFVHDHYAWQQRVRQESKAQQSMNETTRMLEDNGGLLNYPDFMN